MPPFQEFRLWTRRASTSERTATALASFVMAGVLLWMLIPSSGPSTQQSLASAPSASTSTGAGGSSSSPATSGALPVRGPSAGVAGTIAAAGSTTHSGSSGAATRSDSGPAAVPGQGCTSPPGSDTGVTAKTITVSITLANIVGPAGNSTFGVPPADEQRLDYQQVIDAVNAAGGIACRRVLPKFYEVNPADQNGLQQTCLDINQAGVFAELDPSSYALFPQKDCFGQHHIPYITTYYLPASEAMKFYPYMFAFNSTDVLYRDMVFGLRDNGLFRPENGFRKLGFVYRNCFPDLIGEINGWLHQAGVTPSQIVPYSVGCPTGLANPSDLEQAVLKFQQSGVTHVTAANFEGDLANFTNIAQQQGFHPKYGLGDEAIVQTTYGSMHPNFANIAGALMVTASRWGEERTPGVTPTAGTKQCDAIYRAKGRPPTYQQAAGFAGFICDQLWFLKAAAEHAPTLERQSLAAGLQAVKSVEFSYPGGPNDFTKSKGIFAGQYWRLLRFTSSCNCWRLTSKTFHPSYT